MDKKKIISKSRKIFGTILLLICAILIIYFAAVMIYRLVTVLDAKKWSAATRFLGEFGIMCLLSLPAFDLRFGIFTWAKNKAVKVTGFVLRILSLAICAIFIVLNAAIIITGTIKDDDPVENVCVLGLAIDSDKLPKDLINRLDTAMEYKTDHPDVPFIVTGGNSEDPYYSEAGYMSRYLLEQGFDTSLGELIAETEAKTTVGNFENVSNYVDKEKPLGVVTSNLHMFRATGIARKQGYKSIINIPAPSEPLLFCENVMWESICSFFLTLGGKIAF